MKIEAAHRLMAFPGRGRGRNSSLDLDMLAKYVPADMRSEFKKYGIISGVLWRIYRGGEDLDSGDRLGWMRLYETQPQAVLECMTFLEAVKDAQGDIDGSFSHIKLPSSAALGTVNAHFGMGHYSTLFRGITIPDSSKLEVGKVYKVPHEALSFWSQHQDYAKEFADNPNGIILETKFEPATVLLDLNKVPFCLGPEGTGREPEVLLKPGHLNSKVIWVHS